MKVSASEAIAFRFLNEAGPYRQHLLAWSAGNGPMFGPMYVELIGYATGLVVMQRLESRHSLLKRFLAWRHKQYPATLSAAMRRRENQDLEAQTFQDNLPELLGAIGELDAGEWTCKTQFLERVTGASAVALHDSLAEEKKQKESFHNELAIMAGQKQRVSTQEASLIPAPAAPVSQELDLPLIREHAKSVFEKNKFYALKGYQSRTSWTVFRLLSTHPGQNMYLQRACFLSSDDLWHYCHCFQAIVKRLLAHNFDGCLLCFYLVRPQNRIRNNFFRGTSWGLPMC